MSDVFKMFLIDVNEAPVLTPEEEKAVAAKSFAGDLKAREILCQANLRFVISEAKKFSRHSHVPFEELVASGNLGLWIAAGKFDPSRNTKFITCASWWIRDEMQKALRNESPVHYPAHKYAEMYKASSKCISLDSECGKDERSTLVSYLTDKYSRFENHVADALDLALVRKAMNKLTAEERLVMNDRYGLNGSEPCSLQSVADSLGKSKEGIRQIEIRAISRLRSLLRNAA